MQLLRRTQFQDQAQSLDTLAMINPEDLGYYYRRSLVIHVFAGIMGLVFVALLAVVLVPSGSQAFELASIPGAGGAATLGFFGLATLGAYQRFGWGRWLGLSIALVCLLQVAWYAANPVQWKLGEEVVSMGARLLLGWLGCVCFYGTECLFGRGGVGHRELKEAYRAEREWREDLARVHSLDWTPRRDRAA